MGRELSSFSSTAVFDDYPTIVGGIACRGQFNDLKTSSAKGIDTCFVQVNVYLESISEELLSLILLENGRPRRWIGCSSV